MRYKVNMEGLPWQASEVIGACLAISYFFLGLSYIIVFLLTHTQVLPNIQIPISLYQSYSLFLAVLLVTFFGFLVSLMLYISPSHSGSGFTIVWLLFHLPVVCLLTIGGCALSLHLAVNLQQFTRAGLCILPVSTGLLLLALWVRVYSEFLLLRTAKKLRRAQELRLFYQKAFINLYPEMSRDNIFPNKTQPPRSLLSTNTPRMSAQTTQNHFYPHVKNMDQTKPTRIAFVKTNQKHQNVKPHFFFGDQLGLLPKSSAHDQQKETLEASIIFEDDDMGRADIEELERTINSEKDYTRDEIIKIFCHV